MQPNRCKQNLKSIEKRTLQKIDFAIEYIEYIHKQNAHSLKSGVCYNTHKEKFISLVC